MKKINFRQPKYIIPIIILPFLFFFNYIIGAFSKKDTNRDINALKTSKGFNHELPNANTADSLLDNKYNSFRKYGDLSGDLNNIKNPILDPAASDFNLKNDAQEDLLRILKQNDQNRLLEKSLSQNQNPYPKYESQNRDDDKIYELEREQKQLLNQMRMMDSMFLAEKTAISTPPPLLLPDEMIIKKAGDDSSPYFNSIKKEKKDKKITAILDEGITVVQGSRIRLRLLDDIMVNDVRVTKGNYLYATIQGFRSERIRLSITSILVENTIIPAKLDIYDNDGLEGLYVPKSAFRDFTKDMSDASTLNLVNTSSPGNEKKELLYGAINTTYDNASKALRNAAKKNKAKLKYNTIVYLIPKN